MTTPGAPAPSRTGGPATGTAGPGIVVTGATGAVGRHVARLLAERAGTRHSLFVRDPGKAAALGLPGPAVRGDYTDPESLRRALDGADAVFVVTANPLRPEDDERVLAAARAGGVRHAVKLSWCGVADPGADDLVARWNRRSEELLRDSGLSWTVLRIRTPMSNALAWAPSIRDRGVVRAFGGAARTACVDPRDVAMAAVAALTDPQHVGRAYALAGPEPLSPREQTGVLAEVLGRRLVFEEVAEEDARAGWSRRYGERIAEALVSGARRRAGGAAAACDDGTLARLLGGRPRTFGEWATDHVREFI
ncbi:nucleotide-diphosphate-sugar epimerase [Streptomyces olivaceoviridis]|uniref:NAD(P)H-binding protein n=1 Tax=Streptomyces olivaceoviridis TaxID=1921 RepID=UPI001672DECE|nr:NAD(P)H-binding protein [Streptomyces olivaceoviridis]GGY63062.1 nucleotide-diphosphate-sugar epimerase [Streptomyces olivaceoviridis]